MALTGKQPKFVAEYVKDLNATQAAIRAGYSKKTSYSIGQENLKKPEIQLAIQQKQKELAEEDKIDALYIKQQAHKLYLQCSGQLEIKKLITGESGPVSVDVFEFNGPAANKAIENLGKHVDIQAFKEQKEISGGLEITNKKTLKDFYNEAKS